MRNLVLLMITWHKTMLFSLKSFSNEKSKTSESSSHGTIDQSHMVANPCGVGKKHVSTSCDDLLEMPCSLHIVACSTSNVFLGARRFLGGDPSPSAQARLGRPRRFLGVLTFFVSQHIQLNKLYKYSSRVNFIKREKVQQTYLS